MRAPEPGCPCEHLPWCSQALGFPADASASRAPSFGSLSCSRVQALLTASLQGAPTGGAGRAAGGSYQGSRPPFPLQAQQASQV